MSQFSPERRARARSWLKTLLPPAAAAAQTDPGSPRLRPAATSTWGRGRTPTAPTPTSQTPLCALTGVSSPPRGRAPRCSGNQFPPAASPTLTGPSYPWLQQSQRQATEVCPPGSCYREELGSRNQTGSVPGGGSPQSQPERGSRGSYGQSQQQKAGGSS